MKNLIFETDDFLKKVYSKGLFLVLIGIDLENILAGEKAKEFHLLLALGHNERQMSSQFPDEDVRAELRKALNSSLPASGKLELMKSVFKIATANTTIHLHLDGLLRPGSDEGEISASPHFSSKQGMASHGLCFCLRTT
ncbi:hypothetical protein ColTof4_01195 [Colletotrichum tofieldiae]|nr:hypothetical protein ColTof3_08425 [Colletotrichum tofieldiae]GKT68772.1 hypothetical protein ColTof4_01195 [Colletotrichum tofieldiae]GKT88538.1 hypothetical protein Ct61P_06388 [Colletotrichum tofieldiae]